MKFLQFSKIISIQIKRSSSSIIKPVKLAYASYESTDTNPNPVPLIVTHGVFGSKQNWHTLCTEYETKIKRKVIAVDARNHGDSPHSDQHTYASMVEDLVELMKDLKNKKAAFLGHSMGGRTVMYLALKYPELVDKLIVADMTPVARKGDMRSIAVLFTMMQKIKLPKLMSMSLAKTKTDAELARFVKNKKLRNFLLTNLTQKLDGRVNIPVLLANFQDMERFPEVKGLKYEGPVLFVGGANSGVIRERDHGKILGLFPKAEFKYIEGAGHWVHFDKPAEFLDCTVNFLNKT